MRLSATGARAMCTPRACSAISAPGHGKATQRLWRETRCMRQSFATMPWCVRCFSSTWRLWNGPQRPEQCLKSRAHMRKACKCFCARRFIPADGTQWCFIGANGQWITLPPILLLFPHLHPRPRLFPVLPCLLFPFLFPLPLPLPLASLLLLLRCRPELTLPMLRLTRILCFFLLLFLHPRLHKQTPVPSRLVSLPLLILFVYNNKTTLYVYQF